MTEEGRDEALEPEGTGPEGDGTPESKPIDNEAVLQKRFEDTQKAYHEKSAEVSALRERQAKMEGQLEVLAKGQVPPPAPQPDPFDEIDDDAFWEKYYDDPQKARRLYKKQIDVFGNTFLRMQAKADASDKRFVALEGELEKLRSATKKEVPEALRSKIETLRKDPDYADLPDKVLVKFASQMPGSEQFAGSPPAGGRVAAKGSKDPRYKDLSPEARKQVNAVRARLGKEAI